MSACQTDAQRLDVLANAPWRLREELMELEAAHAYTDMLDAPTDTLMLKLDACVDDTQRATLLRTATAKDRAQLANDIRWRNASPTEAADMYLEMIQPDTGV